MPDRMPIHRANARGCVDLVCWWLRHRLFIGKASPIGNPRPVCALGVYWRTGVSRSFRGNFVRAKKRKPNTCLPRQAADGWAVEEYRQKGGAPIRS